MMLEPANLIALLERRRVEWALEGARYPDRDVPPELALGMIVGRDEAVQLILEDIRQIIAEEEDREKER
jgi:hypothetical protein